MKKEMYFRPGIGCRFKASSVRLTFAAILLCLFFELLLSVGLMKERGSDEGKVS